MPRCGAVAPAAGGGATVPQWEWQDDGTTWTPFFPTDSVTVEAAYNAVKKEKPFYTKDLSWNRSFQTQYRYDFSLMQQTNMSSKRNRLLRRTEVPGCAKGHPLARQNGGGALCGGCGEKVSASEEYYTCRVCRGYDRCLGCSGQEVMLQSFRTPEQWRDCFKKLSHEQLSTLRGEPSVSAMLKREGLDIVWTSWSDVGRTFGEASGQNTTDVSFFAVAPDSRGAKDSDRFVPFPAIRAPNFLDEVDVVPSADELRFRARSKCGRVEQVTLKEFLARIGEFISGLGRPRWDDGIDDTPLQQSSSFSVIPTPSGKTDVGIAVAGSRGTANLHVIVGPGGEVGWAMEKKGAQKIFFRSGSDGSEMRSIQLVPEKRKEVTEAFFKVEVRDESVEEEKKRYEKTENRLLHLQIALDGVAVTAAGPAPAEGVGRANNCPMGHGLAAFVIKPGAGFICDICDVDLHAGTQAYGCRQCDFDICPACWTKQGGKHEAKPEPSHWWMNLFSGAQSASQPAAMPAELTPTPAAQCAPPPAAQCAPAPAPAARPPATAAPAVQKQSRLLPTGRAPSRPTASTNAFTAAEPQSSSSSLWDSVRRRASQLGGRTGAAQYKCFSGLAAPQSRWSVEAHVHDSAGPLRGARPALASTKRAKSSATNCESLRMKSAFMKEEAVDDICDTMSSDFDEVAAALGCPTETYDDEDLMAELDELDESALSPAEMVAPRKSVAGEDAFAALEAELAGPVERKDSTSLTDRQGRQVCFGMKGKKAAAEKKKPEKQKVAAGLQLAQVSEGCVVGRVTGSEFAAGMRRKAGVPVRVTWLHYGVAADGRVDAERVRRFTKQIAFRRRELGLDHGSLVSGIGTWGGPDDCPIKLFGMRLTDAADNPRAQLSTIRGVGSLPEQKSLVEACRPLAKVVRGIETAAKHASAAAKALVKLTKGKVGPNPEHIAAMYLYTMEHQFYRALNAAMRDTDREAARPYFAYLRILFDALAAVESRGGRKAATLWRGVNMDLSTDHPAGTEVYWWGASSCTPKMSVARGFLGCSGSRTLFSVKPLSAVPIKEFSAFRGEEEWLLRPGTRLRVEKVRPKAGGLVEIDLVELPPPRGIE
eukprot:TRINITY_DN256_c0_g1_i12.p1 TRINITY_DN256_c0_g1~~TRINITY_DN256_c0_g1_i12.p1  ORF type:complete len:1100 (+),score=327.73 TRINITY_DN256_c0_g1_i12:58-3357(+)